MQDDLSLDDINLSDKNNFLNRQSTAPEIECCILRPKNDKACGSDEILNDYIELTKDVMLSICINLFNLIFNTGIIPEVWSQSKVHPFYKNNGETSDPEYYRSISILNCLEKLFRTLLSDRLSTFLEEIEILSENQGGFRKKYSTTDRIFPSILFSSYYDTRRKRTILLLYRSIEGI